MRFNNRIYMALSFLSLWIFGCSSNAEEKDYYYPTLTPIYWKEHNPDAHDPDKPWATMKELNSEPESALVIPLYRNYRYNDLIDDYAIAHPFLYKRGTDIEKELSSHGQRDRLVRLIFWVPSYFPASMAKIFRPVLDVEGKDLLVLELQKCIDSEETNIIKEMHSLLREDHFTIGEWIDRDIPPNTNGEKAVLSAEPYDFHKLVRTEEYKGRFVRWSSAKGYALWTFKPGTAIINRFSDKDKKTIEEFSQKLKKEIEQSQKTTSALDLSSKGKAVGDSNKSTIPKDIPMISSPVKSDNLLKRIEELASAEKEFQRSATEQIASELAQNPPGITDVLLTKIKKPKLSEHEQMAYSWALGMTKDPKARDELIAFYKKIDKEIVRLNCIRALAEIGGNASGEFILSVLDSWKDKEKQFEILKYLGQMKYEPALPKAGEILTRDPDIDYWQPVFVFGQMGDTGIPFLLDKIDDKDRNVRMNAIAILGLWLQAPEADKLLRERYAKEEDPRVRAMILLAVGETLEDPTVLNKWYAQVIAEEKDERLLALARQMTDRFSKVMEQIRKTSAEPLKPSAEIFLREYKQLFQSAGKQGDYQSLAASSSVSNELQLKALRERILQRGSDEAFYDYKKINKIILINRLKKLLNL
jgi:HEAT repeat protein